MNNENEIREEKKTKQKINPVRKNMNEQSIIMIIIINVSNNETISDDVSAASWSL